MRREREGERRALSVYIFILKSVVVSASVRFESSEETRQVFLFDQVAWHRQMGTILRGTSNHCRDRIESVDGTFVRHAKLVSPIMQPFGPHDGYQKVADDGTRRGAATWKVHTLHVLVGRATRRQILIDARCVGWGTVTQVIIVIVILLRFWEAAYDFQLISAVQRFGDIEKTRNGLGLLDAWLLGVIFSAVELYNCKSDEQAGEMVISD